MEQVTGRLSDIKPVDFVIHNKVVRSDLKDDAADDFQPHITKNATHVQPHGTENANDVQPQADLAQGSQAEVISSKANGTDRRKIKSSSE